MGAVAGSGFGTPGAARSKAVEGRDEGNIPGGADPGEGVAERSQHAILFGHVADRRWADHDCRDVVPDGAVKGFGERRERLLRRVVQDGVVGAEAEDREFNARPIDRCVDERLRDIRARRAGDAMVGEVDLREPRCESPDPTELLGITLAGSEAVAVEVSARLQ